MELKHHEVNYKRFSVYILGLLIIVSFLYVRSCRTDSETIKALQDSIATKKVVNTVLSARIDSLFRVESKLKLELFNCINDKFIESSKKRQYENQIQNFEEDCEHEKDLLLLNNRIDNYTDNELGLLLSRLGQSNSLSDAERLFLSEQTNQGFYWNDSGGNTSEKKDIERREKNKSP